MKNKEVCGTCRHNCYDRDGSGMRQRSGFYCGNERSENCGCPTLYGDSCEDWEGKES